MGMFSVWHWIIVCLALLLLGFPAMRILRRLGFSGWWVILAFLPWANVVALWVLAFIKWPVEER